MFQFQHYNFVQQLFKSVLFLKARTNKYNSTDSQNQTLYNTTSSFIMTIISQCRSVITPHLISVLKLSSFLLFSVFIGHKYKASCCYFIKFHTVLLHYGNNIVLLQYTVDHHLYSVRITGNI